MPNGPKPGSNWHPDQIHQQLWQNCTLHSTTIIKSRKILVNKTGNNAMPCTLCYFYSILCVMQYFHSILYTVSCFHSTMCVLYITFSPESGFYMLLFFHAVCSVLLSFHTVHCVSLLFHNVCVCVCCQIHFIPHCVWSAFFLFHALCAMYYLYPME